MREKKVLVFSAEDARDIIANYHEEFTVVENEILDTSRWEVHYRTVVQHKKTERFYQVYYSEGATEVQDTQPFEDQTEVEFGEVYPVEEVRIVYK